MECRWELGVPAAGYGDGRGRVRGDGKIFPEEVECGRAINCDVDDPGPMQVYGADARGVGF